MKTRTFLKGVGLAVGLALTAAAALAQSYPSRPVKMIVPFPAGSATDLAARMMGQQLTTALGQPFVVDNKPGAGGSIAAMEVIRSTPDGYTLLFSSNSAVSSNVALLKNIPYDPTKDYSPVAGIGETQLALMVKSNSPIKNLKDLIEQAKQRPGKMSAGYGSSTSQISIAILNKLAGTNVLSVPYKGIPLAVNDVLGGTTDFTFVDIGNSMAQTKGGNMRPLGVTSLKRTPLVPDWPAIAETLPGFEVTAWFAIVGPAGLPKDVVDKLNGAVTNILKQPEAKEKLGNIGLSPMPMTAEELKAFIARDITKWQQMVKDANIQPQ